MVDAQKFLKKYFPKTKDRNKVTELTIGNQKLKGHLDLSDFINLERLDCSHNSLTSIELRNCSKLTKLDCSDNRLRQLELRGLNSLTDIKCIDNYLPNFEVGQLAKQCQELQDRYENLVRKVEEVKRITGIVRISDTEELEELETLLEGKSVKEVAQIGHFNESRVNQLRKENSSLRKRVTELIMGSKSKADSSKVIGLEERIIDDYLSLQSQIEIPSKK